MTDRPDQRLGHETERKALGPSARIANIYLEDAALVRYLNFMQLATVTCPNQALTNCGHYTKVQYRDSEPNNTPENMYIAMHESVRLLLPLKRICGYNPPQCLVFLSVPPDVIERDPRVGLARIFRIVSMGNFPRIDSTHQLSLYHSPFYLFLSNRVRGTFPRIYTDLFSL